MFPRFLALAALSLSLLSACTGTTEPTVSVGVALVNQNGNELRSVVGPGTSAAAQPVTGALDLQVLASGKTVVVAYRDHLETRGLTLQNPVPLPGPGSGFTPCFVRLAISPARDRVAALSDCGNGAAEQLAVYRSDGLLDYTATLPPPTPTDSANTRFTITPDLNIWVARPAIGGGSELLRVSSAGITVVTNPPLSTAVHDLAVRGGTLYAATDQGVLAVNPTSGALAATPVISGVINRLYSDNTLLAAWLLDSSASSQALTLWDGTRRGVPAYPADLRDVTFGPDGKAYLLSGNKVTSYDTVFGFQRGDWQPTDLITTLQGARALTWIAP
ncbi:hypothetical protein [Deinococcus sonorensis]|uniref:Lipoprotein n=2 Tax=Deinococcus sonorensis TaxID=309891 RepID=A0AAU7UDQ9_9DEIO